ncbi:MAG: SWIM zinc finger family protein [Myxococcota bacterium]
MSAAAGVDVEGEAVRDPLLVHAEALRGLASDAVVKRGVRYFKEDRVHGLGWMEGHVWASVEGSRPGEPYEVELAVDEDGEIGVECSCPFDQEPTCKHAVATLLAYAARQEVGDETVRGAADEAVADRRKRGRTGVTVTHVGGDRWFGTWEARSLNPTGVSSRTYRVELRSVGERINHCTCPDFATNRLGTCKHIEAVVHKLASRAHRKASRWRCWIRGRSGASDAWVSRPSRTARWSWSAPRTRRPRPPIRSATWRAASCGQARSSWSRAATRRGLRSWWRAWPRRPRARPAPRRCRSGTT